MVKAAHYHENRGCDNKADRVLKILYKFYRIN